MNKFGTGFIVGNIVGMASILLGTSKNPKKTIAKSTRLAIEKFGELADDLMQIYR